MITMRRGSMRAHACEQWILQTNTLRFSLVSIECCWVQTNLYGKEAASMFSESVSVTYSDIWNINEHTISNILKQNTHMKLFV